MAIRNLEDGASRSRGAVKVEIKFVCDIDSEEVSVFNSYFLALSILLRHFSLFLFEAGPWSIFVILSF